MSSTLQTSIAATLYRTFSTPALSSVNRLALSEAPQAAGLQASQSSSTISSLGQLLSNLSDFQTALSNYQAPQFTPNTVAISSNTSVADATVRNSATGTYALAVSPLASKQTVNSADYGDADKTMLGSGMLVIQSGNYNTTNNSFTPSGDATSLTVGTGTLKNLASSINAANAGISAAVISNSNGYHLQLSSTTTGSASAFQISGDIQALNVDPTDSSSSSLTISQQASDAAYSVDSSNASYTSNSGVPITPSISANFYQTGSTTLTTVPDLSSVQAATKNLVDAYNTLQSAVAKEDQQSTSLLHNMLAKQLPSDMALLVSSNFSSGQFSQDTLGRLGISAKPTSSDAQSLTLDSNALQQSYAADPVATATLLASATQAFTELGRQYTATVKAGSDALGLTSILAKSNPLLKVTANNYLNTAGSSGNATGYTPWATTATGNFASTNSTKASTQDLQNYASSALQNGDLGLQSAAIKSLQTTNTATASTISVFV